MLGKSYVREGGFLEDVDGFDAAFLGIGAHVSRRVDIPSRDAGRIYDAIGFLQQVEKLLKSPQAVIDFFQCTFHIVIGRVLMESLAQAF